MGHHDSLSRLWQSGLNRSLVDFGPCFGGGFALREKESEIFGQSTDTAGDVAVYLLHDAREALERLAYQNETDTVSISAVVFTLTTRQRVEED